MARVSVYTNIEELNMTTITDPATNAAVTTAIIDAYDGVVITLNGAGNAQTLQDPSETTVSKRITVVNHSTSTYNIPVNGHILEPGESQSWVWDGAAWCY